MKVEVPEISLSHTTVYKRITANKTQGGEFAAHEKVSEAMNADVFFAKPYASYQ